MANYHYIYTNDTVIRNVATPKRISGTRTLRSLFLMLLIMICFAFGALVHAYAGNNNDIPHPVYAKARAADANGGSVNRVVEVRKGDTLWKIAAAHTPKGKDIRSTVYRLKTINGLSGSILREGQLLVLP